MYPLYLFPTEIYNRVYQLLEINISPSEIYMNKDRAHGAGLNNMLPGSHGMLIKPRIFNQMIIL